ncbi:MAG: bifunctional riboflavin kinase/FAD synthetase, partial [Oxalobacteraceae bacterium]
PALSGIYATWVHGVAERPWPSVSSFGTRPTVAGVEPLLEAHLFDFQGDLYGRHIAVEFVAKLRDEEKFDGLDALTVQMHRDAEQARAVLDRRAISATHASSSQEHITNASSSQQPTYDASPSQQHAYPCADDGHASSSQTSAHVSADTSDNAAQR